MTDFGKDTSCTDALRPGVIVSGARLVGEAAYRRLTTPRGMLRGGDEEASYGFDVFELIGAVSSKSAIAAIPGRVRNELLKDERILNVEVTPTVRTDGPVTSILLEVRATTDDGPFTLTLTVDETSTELLGIAAS